MTSLAPYVLAVAGVSAPLLLQEARRAGVPIPVFVTKAQQAAMGALSSRILGVPVKAALAGDQQTSSRFLEIVRELRPIKGALGANFAQLSQTDGFELCTAFLGACKAGIEVDDGYRVTLAPSNIAGLDTDASTFEQLEVLDKPTFPLSSLGKAVQDVVTERARANLPLSTLFDATRLQAAVGHLAIEMDSQGHLETGKPPEPIGVLDALGISGEFLGSLPGRAATALASVVGNAAASALLSTPGILLVGGYLAYRAVKKS